MRTRRIRGFLLCLACAAMVSGCVQSGQHDPQPPHYVPLDGPPESIGIDSADIRRAADLMVADILEAPVLAGRSAPPKVVVNPKKFHNE